VAVQVTVGGVEQVNEPAVDTRIRTLRCTLQGVGTQQVVVFVDGVQTQSFNQPFSE